MKNEPKKKLEDLIDQLTSMVINDEFDAHEKDIVLTAIDSMHELTT